MYGVILHFINKVAIAFKYASPESLILCSSEDESEIMEAICCGVRFFRGS